MSLHFLAALAGSLIAAAGTGLLAARCLRVPNGALIAWTVALLGLTVALAAQAVGFHAGFGPVTFRAMELGGQVVAPLALAFGLAELAGKSITARFAARLVLSALAIVSVVILATDPLSAAAFSKAWPAPTVYYQIVPGKLLEYVLAPVTTIVALIAVASAGARPGRDPAWRDAIPAAAAGAAAAILLSVPGLATALGETLPLSTLFVPLCVVAAVATAFAGLQVARLRLDVLRQDVGGGSGEWAPHGAWPSGSRMAGDFGPVAADDDEFGIYRTNGFRRGQQELEYRGSPEYGDDRAFPGGEPEFPGRSGCRDDRDYGDDRYCRDDPHPDDSGFGRGAGHPGTGGQQRAPFFGQIAIYTLLDDRVADFDELTKGVVRQVQAHEPDTLVYIVHAVPSAPMQRILYEVYRDRAAYEWHKRQPYVADFEADRRPYVLATNVIELGLQQAKVSPLPSVADLLSDTGYDLLSDTGFGKPGYAPRPGSGGPGTAQHTTGQHSTGYGTGGSGTGPPGSGLG